ncbi:MAG: L,D-transpeptidase family protein [Selenomonadaceae bacterium]|nr:L,D-transpeptidase family protein [Selenomonadaceae bacterium]
MSALKFFTAIICILTIFAAPAQAQKKILINSASRLMLFYDGDTKLAVYHLGLGKVETPTPTGYYKINSKEINPPWIDPNDPEYEVPSGPDNPLGYRWMEFSGNYGIHGTNRPESIGGYVSNGCIRMNERDVEELFDAVEVGTPVEITYNRVVVEKSPDGDVVYYIYPDGYGMQDLTVADVTKWLEPFGVLAFESDYDISQKIEASDGEPTYIGKPFNVEINGQLTQPTDANNTRFFAKAVIRDGITYMPVVPIAKILRLKLEWNKSESSLKSRYGKVVCYEKKNQLYCNADDAPILFNMEGGLQTDKDGTKIFRFKSLPAVTTPTTPDKPKTDKPKVDIPNREVDAPFKNKADEPKPEEKPPTVDEPKPEEKSLPADEPKPAENLPDDESIKKSMPTEELKPEEANV